MNKHDHVIFDVRLVLPDQPINLRACEEAFAFHLIQQALDRCGGNRNQAAKLLKMNRTTLVERLRKRKAFDA